MSQNVDELISVITKGRDAIMKSAFRSSTGTSGMTMLQHFALKYIQTQKMTTASTLGEFLGLSASSTTQLINRLEAGSLIKRQIDKKDKRVTWILLTLTGTKKLDLFKKEMDEKMRRIFSQVEDADIQELVRIHKHILEIIQKENA